MNSADAERVIERRHRIEAALAEVVRGRRQKDLYAVAEAAVMVGKD